MQCIGYKSFPGNSQLVQFNMISIHIYIFYPGFFNVGLEFSEKKTFIECKRPNAQKLPYKVEEKL